MQQYPVELLWNRRKTLTGSPDPTRANRPCSLSKLCGTLEFFTVYTKLAEMAILASKDLRTPKKKLPPVGLDLMHGIITGL